MCSDYLCELFYASNAKSKVVNTYISRPYTYEFIKQNINLTVTSANRECANEWSGVVFSLMEHGARKACMKSSVKSEECLPERLLLLLLLFAAAD